ncbi:MAG TPA: STAS domain-containing protein [Methylotenera sp.]|jgi:phospholipid transport system transporter-binding protein
MSITLQDNQWYVSGDILVDNANAVLNESNALEITDDLQIDFSAVNDVDTAALSLLIEWQRRALAVNKKVEFKKLPESLISLAALYGVTDFIPLSAN